jgi:hypothetical protein
MVVRHGLCDSQPSTFQACKQDAHLPLRTSTWSCAAGHCSKLDMSVLRCVPAGLVRQCLHAARSCSQSIQVTSFGGLEPFATPCVHNSFDQARPLCAADGSEPRSTQRTAETSSTYGAHAQGVLGSAAGELVRWQLWRERAGELLSDWGSIWSGLTLTTHLTWQPNVLKRKRTHGFLKRCAVVLSMLPYAVRDAHSRVPAIHGSITRLSHVPRQLPWSLHRSGITA